MMARNKNHLFLVQTKSKQPKPKKFPALLLKVLVVLSLLILLKYGAAYFRISEIKVAGTASVAKEKVIAASGLKKGRSIFLLNEKKIKERIIKEYPVIKEVETERDLPDLLLIKVTERSLLAYLKAAGGYWMIDQEAVCFSFTKEIKAGIPVISGIKDSANSPAELLTFSVRGDTLRNFFANWPGPEYLAITSMDFSDPHNLVVKTEDGWEVWLGDGQNMESKLLLVNECISYYGEEAQGLLDVRSGKRLVVSESSMISKREEER